MLDTDTLIAGTSVSPFLAIAVNLIKGSTPAAWWQGKAGDSRAILLTLALGPLVLLLLWAPGGFLPGWMGWQDALRTGFTAAIQASGLYSYFKGTLPAKAGPQPQPQPPVLARRSTPPGPQGGF